MMRQVGVFLIAASISGALGFARAEANDAQGVPEHSGAHQVVASVNQAGARLTLKNGFSLVVPPGLLAVSSRTLTLKVAKQRVHASDIAEGFVPIGPIVELDAALSGNGEPIEASYAAERFRPRKGHKLVLASEQAGFCDPQKQQAKLAGGLCAEWVLVDASYGDGHCRAALKQTGGHRMQFGSVPASPESSKP